MIRFAKISTLFFMFLMLWGCPQAESGSRITDYEEVAITAVHNAAVGLGAVLQEMETAEQISFLRTFITPIRFYPDSTGYFYIYDYNCVNIAHAIQKDLEGKNLYDHRDSKGKYVIRELSAAAANGGGFVEFFWQKLNDLTEYRKLGYVEPIPGTDYFIGSGVYLK